MLEAWVIDLVNFSVDLLTKIDGSIGQKEDDERQKNQASESHPYPIADRYTHSVMLYDWVVEELYIVL